MCASISRALHPHPHSTQHTSHSTLHTSHHITSKNPHTTQPWYRQPWYRHTVEQNDEGGKRSRCNSCSPSPSVLTFGHRVCMHSTPTLTPLHPYTTPPSPLLHYRSIKAGSSPSSLLLSSSPRSSLTPLTPKSRSLIILILILILICVILIRGSSPSSLLPPPSSFTNQESLSAFG